MINGLLFIMSNKGSELSKQELSVKIGLQIKALRADLGISQAELARRTNKDPQHVELLENGKVSPNVYTLYLVSRALEVPLSDLFT